MQSHCNHRIERLDRLDERCWEIDASSFKVDYRIHIHYILSLTLGPSGAILLISILLEGLALIVDPKSPKAKYFPKKVGIHIFGKTVGKHNCSDIQRHSAFPNACCLINITSTVVLHSWQLGVASLVTRS